MPRLRVVVVDNASPDDSVPAIREAIANNQWSDWISLLPLQVNDGFAAGNNAAIAPALQCHQPPDYVLMLNPDTVVRRGAVPALAQFLDANPQVGIAGSRLESADGTPQRSAFRFHSVLSELDGGVRLGLVSKLLWRHRVAPPVPEEPGRTDWVAGASMMIRREVFERIGLIDAGYFMYFEEVDFCLRAARAGWPCWYVPASRVVHFVGRSSGITDANRRTMRRPAYWFHSRRRYFLRNHGRFKALLADVAWAGGFASYRLRRLIQRKPDNDPANFLWDFVRYNFFAGGRKADLS